MSTLADLTTYIYIYIYTYTCICASPPVSKFLNTPLLRFGFRQLIVANTLTIRIFRGLCPFSWKVSAVSHQQVPGCPNWPIQCRNTERKAPTHRRTHPCNFFTGHFCQTFREQRELPDFIRMILCSLCSYSMTSEIWDSFSIIMDTPCIRLSFQNPLGILSNY